MNQVFDLIEQNHLLLYLLCAVLVVITGGILVFILILFLAYRAGREVRFWPPGIGKKDIREEAPILPTPQPDSQPPRSQEVFLSRRNVYWGAFTNNISSRYWVCGTSLIGVSERTFLKTLFAQGMADIKILLPSTSAGSPSRIQLQEYDQLGQVVCNQIETAEDSYESLEIRIESVGKYPEDHLRRYRGIMYSNITICDDEAFISFYDSTGVGDSNITLRFNRKCNETGYRRVEDEFLGMWNASKQL